MGYNKSSRHVGQEDKVLQWRHQGSLNKPMGSGSSLPRFLNNSKEIEQDLVDHSQTNSSIKVGNFGNVVIEVASPTADDGFLRSDNKVESKNNQLHSKTFAKNDTSKTLIRNSVKNNFIFESLSNAQLEQLIDDFCPVSCKKGQQIIKQGASENFMYVIESGCFDIIKNGEILSTEFGSGKTIGELALLYNAKRSASVICNEDALIWALDGHTFRRFRDQNVRRMNEITLQVLSKMPSLKHLDRTQLVKASEIPRVVKFEENVVIKTKTVIDDLFYIILEGVISISQSNLLFGIGENDHEDKDDNVDIDDKNDGKSLSTMDSKNLSSSVLKNDDEPEEEEAPLMFRESNRTSSLIGAGRLKAGDWFGENSLLGLPNTNNYVADSNVRLLAIDRESFEKVLGSMQEILERKADKDKLLPLPLISRFPEDKRNEAVNMFSVETYSNLDIIAFRGDENAKFIYVKSGSVLLIDKEVGARMHRRTKSITSATVRFSPKASQPSSSTTPDLFSPNQSSSSTSPPPKDQNTDEHYNLGVTKLLASHTALTKSCDSNSMESVDEITSPTSIPPSAMKVTWSFEGANNINTTQEENVTHNDEKKTENKGESGLDNTRLVIEESSLAELIGRASEIGPGEYVGAPELIDGTPMKFMMIAKGDVHCLELCADDYQAVMARVVEEEEEKAKKKDSSNLMRRLIPSASRAQTFSKIESNTVSDSWKSLQRLGRIDKGKFGVVYIVQDSDDNKTYAMKVISHEMIKQKNRFHQLETEFKIMKLTNNPFICRLYGLKQDPLGVYLLLELVQGGELKNFIHYKDPAKREQQLLEIRNGRLSGIPHEPAKFYIAGISIALAHLHRRSIIYRDLNPGNVMIDQYGFPKLVSFGFAKQININVGEQAHTLCGTPEYLAPEMIFGRGYGQAVDWWALGVVLYELIVGMTPFLKQGVPYEQQAQMDVFQNIVDNKVTYFNGIEAPCKDLIQRLLTTIPSARLGCGFKAHKEFEQHAWFRDTVDWHALKKHRVNPPWIPPLQDNTDSSLLVLS